MSILGNNSFMKSVYKKLVKNGDGVYTLLQWYFNKFISKYEIFQGVCEDCKLTTVAKVSLLSLLRKIFKRLEMVTLRKKNLKCPTVLEIKIKFKASH